MNRSGLTLVEILIAVSLSAFVCAIGFTGITAFGRSITRAKQFASETELITIVIRVGIAGADKVSGATSSIDSTILASGSVPVPKNWTACTINNSGDLLTFQAQSSISAAIGGGDIRTSMNMDSTYKNTLSIRTLSCF